MPNFNKSLKLASLAGVVGYVKESQTNSKILKLEPEMMGADYWTAKTGVPNAKLYSTGLSLNGYGYSLHGDTNSGSPYYNENVQYNDIANTWTQKSVTGSVVAETCSTFVLNNFGYMAAGGTSGQTSATFAYNDSANLWSTKSNSSLARILVTGFALSGLGYICQGSNGSDQSLIEQYNDITNAWVSKANSPAITERSASFVLNGFGYIFSGSSAGTQLSTTSQYNDSANVWSAMATSGTIKINPGAFAINGFGYHCIGRNGASTYLSELLEYNDASKNWVSKSNSGTARMGPGSFDLNSCGYISAGYNGGWLATVEQYRNFNYYSISGAHKTSNLTPKLVLVGTNINGSAVSLPIKLRTDGTNWKTMISNVDSLVKTGQTVNSVLAFNAQGYYTYEIQVGIPSFFAGIGSGYWITKANAGTARLAVSSFSLNGFGYNSNGGITGSTYSNEFNQYNDNLDTWISKTSNTTSIRDYCGGASLNGFGYVYFGGGTAVYYSDTTQYNDSANTWATKTTGGTARIGNSPFTLNGFVYACGGQFAGPTESSETNQYNDSTNTWVTKANMSTAKHSGCGYSLNGIGYSVGGSTGSETTDHQFYNDASNVWATKSATTNARQSTGGFSIGGFGYVTCGLNSTTTNNETNQYNDASNLWYVKAVNGTKRRGLCGFSLSGFGYVASGYSDEVTTYRNEVNQYITNDGISQLTVSLRVEE